MADRKVLEHLIACLTDESVPEQGIPDYTVAYDGQGGAAVILRYKLTRSQTDQLIKIAKGN